MTNAVYIVQGSRTPFGKFGGGLREISAIDLAAIASKDALERSRIEPQRIDDVIFGNVHQTSSDAIYFARHVALKSGIPESTPALTVNRICGSGLQAAVTASQQILLGEAEVVLAGGAENMSLAPYVIRGGRFSKPLNGLVAEDTLYGETSVFYDTRIGRTMGATAETLAERYNITRDESDEYALRSQTRATYAIESGRFAQEIIPVSFEKRGKVTEIVNDEHPRRTTIEELSKLRAAFVREGQVTAGNSSGINDGAAAYTVVSENAVNSLNLSPIARIRSWSVVGVDPAIMGIGPVPAIRKAVEKAGLQLSDIDLFEINEAFAAQYLAVERELDLDRSKVNVNGGAIALGHPLGATGARLLLTLATELRNRSAKFGVSSACIGGGQGIAVVVESC